MMQRHDPLLGDPPLLVIQDLCTSFVDGGHTSTAVDGVSLQVRRGQTVALVGESGCGKSVTALSIMGLLPQPPGRIDGGRALFACDRNTPPIDLLSLDESGMGRVRGGKIAMIFQDPLSSLHPVYSVGDQVVEALELHRGLRGAAARAVAVELLDKVGIADAARRVHDFPHEMSGGMQQRVMIAMALACEPALLIADEPTTALDVTIQAQVLTLLENLRTETGLSMLLITHDLGVVARTADYAYVMYAGRIVEHAAVGELFANPLHPYTQALLRCTPRLDVTQESFESIPGSVPKTIESRDGCLFHPRCSLTMERARRTSRPSVELDTGINEEITASIANGDADESQHSPRERMSGSQTKVLAHCVHHVEGEASGVPPLAELRPNHNVACWEAGTLWSPCKEKRGAM